MARRSRPSNGRDPRARASGEHGGRGWGRSPDAPRRAIRASVRGMTTASRTLPARRRAARRRLRRPVVEPGDADYDRARAGWNGAIDRRPAAVAYATDADDVAAAIRAARAAGLPFTIRAGGHSVSGRSVRDGALCIDLRALERGRRRPRPRRSCASAAARCSASSTRRRRSTGSRCPAGQISHTGVGGLTLGGGIGWLMRHHGLTIDSLLGGRGRARRRRAGARERRRAPRPVLGAARRRRRLRRRHALRVPRPPRRPDGARPGCSSTRGSGRARRCARAAT